jgi:hypothetical protein
MLEAEQRRERGAKITAMRSGGGACQISGARYCCLIWVDWCLQVGCFGAD